MTPSWDREAAPGAAPASRRLDIDGDRPAAGGRVRKEIPAWLVGVAGLAIAVGLALRLLIPYGMDPTIFVSFGDESPAHTAYMQRLLGDVTTRPDFWPDGKFFFVQANDPWYLEPQENAVLLDRPIYRAQRMLYPMIAGGFGLLPPSAIVWSMLVMNVAAMAIGAWLGAKLASRWGAHAWLGLLVPLNIGLLFEFETGGAGILAYTCCLAAVYALERDRTLLASVLFGAAALTKEAMVAFPFGVLVLLWLGHRKPLWRIVLVPISAMAVWNAYLRIRLQGIHGVEGGRGNIGFPFVGLFEAFRSWTAHPAHLLINVAIITIVVVFVPLAIRSGSPLAWGALPFVALGLVLTAAVWRETFDFTRALAPVFTAIPFVVFISGHPEPRLWVADEERA